MTLSSLSSTTSDRRAYLKALCQSIPYPLVEKVLENPDESALATQVFDGCALFADLVGFTSLCESIDANQDKGLSQISSLLNQVFEYILEKVIIPYGGEVIHFGGDSATVIFRQRDREVCCAAAALRIQQIMRQDFVQLQSEIKSPLRFRIGMTTGPITLSVFGDMIRRVVVGTGQTIHQAVRLQQRAEPGSIVIDRFSQQALASKAVCQENRDDTFVLKSLQSFPATIDKLPQGDLDTRIEEKIALLEPFVPEPLLLQLKSAPAGWRILSQLRELIVVFVEIWGLDEEINQPQTSANLARSLMRAFRKYGGIISKFDIAERGHRILVLFGLYEPMENDAERALLAAQEASTRLHRFTLAKEIKLKVRTGVHLGQVYFGTVGSDSKHDITIVGDHVNIAARVAHVAEDFQTVSTAPIIKQTQGAFVFTPLAPMRVKGKSKQLHLFCIHSTATNRAHFLRKRKERRFCTGRQEEAAWLQERVVYSLQDHSQVVGICGNPGEGKSFLLANIIDDWAHEGGTGILSRCRYTSKSTPLDPFISVLYTIFSITKQDSETLRRKRIRRVLHELGLDSGVNELVTLLEPVVHADGSTELLNDFMDPESRDNLLSCLIQLFEKYIQKNPLLIILEDLHLADSLTIRLVMRFTAIETKAKFLMLVTYRPVPVLTEMRKTIDRELKLKPVTLVQATDILLRQLQAKEVDTHIIDFVWKRSAGNPEHLIELVRFLIERNLLLVRNQRVDLPEAGIRVLDEIVPKTRSQIIMARLEKLGTTERQLLRIASVIGERFNRLILENIPLRGMTSELFEVGLRNLLDRGVLASEPGHFDTIKFQDDVTRAVTYSTIPSTEKQKVHEQIADCLEKYKEINTAATPTLLALHREKAAQFRQAANWYYHAIKTSANSLLDRETRILIQSWEKVLGQLNEEDHPPLEQQARIALYKLVATARLGYMSQVLPLVRKIRKNFSEYLDVESNLLVDLWLGKSLRAISCPDKALYYLKKVYHESKNVTMRCDAALALVHVYEHNHDGEKAQTWLSEAEALAGSDTYRWARIELKKANLLADGGDLESARAIYIRVQQAETQNRSMLVRAIATTNLAYCDMLKGDFEIAQTGFEQSIILDHSMVLQRDEAQDLCNLGQCLLWAGRPNDAQDSLEKALAIGMDLGDDTIITESKVHLGLALGLISDIHEGVQLCEEGYRMALALGDREIEIAAEFHLLRLALLEENAEHIKSYARRCDLQKSRLKWPLFKKIYQELKAQADFFLKTNQV